MPGLPDSVAKLQHAVRGNVSEDYKAFAQSINEQNERLLTIRGLMQLQVRRQGNPDRRRRTRGRDRETLRHRRDELRLDQPRGAYHARHRNEPHRRPLQHRRGRRRSRTASCAMKNGDSMRSAHQAGRIGPLWRHHRIPGQRRRHPDQDGAGRQARRRRPAARATRSTRTSPRCAIRRPASASSRRRRTTTSIRSRISPS